MSQPLNHFAIAFNPQIPEAEPLSVKISAFMEQAGATIEEVGAIHDRMLRQRIKKKEFEALIVLGGDGTMLRASHLCASARLPLLGVNLGSFGFLMELQRNDWEDYLGRLMSGEYRIEERMLLQAEHFRQDTSRGSWLVVNDVVVCRGQHVRPIRLDAEVDGYHNGQLRGRRVDRFNAYRLYRLRLGCRRGDHAAGSAQHYRSAGRAASFPQPIHYPQRRRRSDHHRQHVPPGSLLVWTAIFRSSWRTKISCASYPVI